MAETPKFNLIVSTPGSTDTYPDAHDWSFQVKENGSLRVETEVNGEVVYYAPGQWTRAAKRRV